MRYLLDTHAALFWWSNSAQLSGAARDAISDPASTILVSAASAWEIATRFRSGKLGDIGDPSIHFPRLMLANGFTRLDITQDHGLRGGALAGSHRDPFDRLIAAQALMESLTIITRDGMFAAFGCKVIW